MDEKGNYMEGFMKKFVLTCVLFLAACQSESVIDWVDFIQLDGKQYEAIYSGVISDPSLINGEIGEIRYEVSENVTSTNYRVKDGDAAFWEKGTKVFAIEGEPELAAIKDDSALNGYRIYEISSAGPSDYQLFKDMDQKAVTKVEIYQQAERQKLVRTLTDKQEIHDFLTLLNKSKKDSSFLPDTDEKDPLSYPIVFYTSDPIARQFAVHYDGKTWHWYPDDTEILPDEMGAYFN